MTIPEIIPSKRLTGKVDGLFMATGKDFVSAAVDELPLAWEGITGDFHTGLTRKSGSREPWYSRGTEMRNERQMTILSRDELAEAAAEMGLDAIEPEWIGANITPRRHSDALHAAGFDAAVLRGRGDAQGRFPERSLQDRRRVHRPPCRAA
jgi:hypothetical protein